MNFGEYKAQLVTNPGMMSTDLWLYRVTGRIRCVLNHKGELKEIKDGSQFEPDDYFVRFDTLEQLKSIADAFSDYGIKTNNDHKNEGLLEATKYHLEDMRRIALNAKGRPRIN